MRRRRRRARVAAGVIRVGDILATLFTLAIDGRTPVSICFIFEETTGVDLPVYLLEVALRHALRTLKEWMLETHQERTLIRNITMRASNALLHYGVSKWMRGEGCSFSSPAASGVLQEISDLPQWLSVYLAYLPFYIPDTFGSEGLRREVRTHLCHAEYLRAPILPQQSTDWVQSLSQVTCTTGELKNRLLLHYVGDVRRVIQTLAEPRLVSASILLY